MKGVVGNTLCAVSFAALAVAGPLAVRSLWTGDILEWEVRHISGASLERKICILSLEAGSVTIGWLTTRTDPEAPLAAGDGEKLMEGFPRLDHWSFKSISGRGNPAGAPFRPGKTFMGFAAAQYSGFAGGLGPAFRVSLAWRALVFPLWLPVLLLAVLPARWLYLAPRRRRTSRSAKGLCPTCGYDIRVHKPGDKCPECGIAIHSASNNPTPPA